METTAEALLYRLRSIPGANVEFEIREHFPLAGYTRFGLGGEADLFVESRHEATFLEALAAVREADFPNVVLGGGTNLLVSDEGFRGAVLRYRGHDMGRTGELVRVETGAELQALVDYTMDEGLAGLHTMTRIPGWVGGAIYGNAGAYGHSIMESVYRVRIFDGQEVRWIGNQECEFAYRESAFKKHKDWILLAAELKMPESDVVAMRAKAGEIARIRDEKYPLTMKCAGSIFKNCLFAELPPAAASEVPAALVREGKVPSAWFLEQVGAKGMRRGEIQVAAYHANLIYNDGEGKAADVCALICELKGRVEKRFGFTLQEEVQYVGFADRG